ncbi:hypothetical protein ABB37_08326 [Leptomonas pyrrhocoris]|uniref:SET domain-containing protein n=1 Tax=Leptomonas pyrrhocoris TaxID=157538 RepID=A0A0N0DSM1_LEPPY|nr:hypothetical protein ABB37_08326 [Leptomonas pyrrhocoris]KPA75804.1 hypothetical protein ABB37_08326 [Leptomonas pyrrhocoris]|eukprot:XP_015654243.1 hypothetical protein ABB37_08326 [Leptomonas pyrrhocoris]
MKTARRTLGRGGAPPAARLSCFPAPVAATRPAQTAPPPRMRRSSAAVSPRANTSAVPFTAPCRFYTTSAHPSASTSLLPQPQQPQQQPRRRSKRCSYADADRVYAADATRNAGIGSKADEVGDAKSALGPSSPPASPYASRAAAAVQQHRGGVLRRVCTRMRQQWQIIVLTLLRTPYVGVLVARFLEASAYAAYVKGSVVLFTRTSTSPPITDVAPDADLRSPNESAASPPRQARSAVFRSSSSATSSPPRLLNAHALDCLYVGQSRLHSRGLFTSKALPRGTRVIAEPQRSLLLVAHFLTLLSDTSEKLPDTWHYTHPTGSVMELVTQAQPHHLLNHSCRANVCSGLSRVFWPAALLAAERQEKRRNCRQSPPTQRRASSGASHVAWEGNDVVSLDERLTRWPHFADANSFFLTRDVAAGEELTLDYSKRMAPLYAGELGHGTGAQGWLLCSCGEPCCRHFVYRHSPDAAEYLRHLHPYGGMSSRRAPSQQQQQQQQQQRKSVDSARKGEVDAVDGDVQDALHITATLLELGFDDELVLLSYAARPSDVVAYLYGQPLPSFGGAGAAGRSAAQVGIDVARRRVSKRVMLQNYRHVFRLLNEAVPLPPRHAAPNAKD